MTRRDPTRRRGAAPKRSADRPATVADETAEPPEGETPESAAEEETEHAAEAASGPHAGGEATSPAPAREAPDAHDEARPIDVIPDELSLVRAQLDSGLAALAEGTAARRIAQLEGLGTGGGDELDGARLLLAEALWRQLRPIAARAALDAIRPGSAQRRRPIAMLIEAEALAAAGEPDRAAGLMERAVAAIGVVEAWRLRAGLPSRLPWPLPDELRPQPRRAERPPWAAAPEPGAPVGDGPRDVARTASAHAHLEAARAAYGAGDVARGDEELSIAVRLDPAVAGVGVALIEPTLGDRPPTDRLLLYGDLLRATGRASEADDAYQRAAQARS